MDIGQLTVIELMRNNETSRAEKFKMIKKGVKKIAPDGVKITSTGLKIIIYKKTKSKTKLDVRIEKDFKRRYIDVNKEIELIKKHFKSKMDETTK